MTNTLRVCANGQGGVQPGEVFYEKGGILAESLDSRARRMKLGNALLRDQVDFLPFGD